MGSGVSGEILDPRQMIGSVPYALVAEDVVADPTTSTVGALIEAAQTAATNAQATASDAQAAANANALLIAPVSNLQFSGANSALGLGALLQNEGIENTAVGRNALRTNTAGGANTAVGVSSLQNNADGSSNTASGAFALFDNTTGSNNTAVGRSALQANTSGASNTAVGRGALSSNQTGVSNTASGTNALRLNVDGYYNTAVGAGALENTTAGHTNTAVGRLALFSNQGNVNTAVGANALENNTTGSHNAAVGQSAMRQNVDGAFNTVIGSNAMTSNISGSENVVVGQSAAHLNQTGIRNVAIGQAALEQNTSGSFNTAVGENSLQNAQGSSNIALGHHAGLSMTTGDNNILIGNSGVDGESNAIRIGTPGTHTTTHLTGNVLIDGAPIGSGAEGPAGPAGPKGDHGDPGIQGIPGLPGANGATGATGAQGPIGLTGPEGPQGIPGAAGTDHTAEIAALQALLESMTGGGLRFLACADGLTVADLETGLLWERKTGVWDPTFCGNSGCRCADDPGGCPDPHDVNNVYGWSASGTAPDGNAFTDFLFNLNAGSGFAGHTDWRMPLISELQTFLLGAGVEITDLTVFPADPAMGTNPTFQRTSCDQIPCVDPRSRPSAVSLHLIPTGPSLPPKPHILMEGRMFTALYTSWDDLTGSMSQP